MIPSYLPLVLCREVVERLGDLLGLGRPAASRESAERSLLIIAVEGDGRLLQRAVGGTRRR